MNLERVLARCRAFEARAASVYRTYAARTRNDPATPYEQTAKLADMLGTGVVLTWEGEGHTAYPETRCINNAVDSYLINLTVPRAGTDCPAS